MIDKMVLSGVEQILDLGGGDAYLTHCIAQHVPYGRVIGLDASPRDGRRAFIGQGGACTSPRNT
jgi:trans-aconitate methyltransferase